MRHISAAAPLVDNDPWGRRCRSYYGVGMVDGFASGSLLGHVYTFQNGLTVRLRLARTSDAGPIGGLLARHGVDAPDLAAARLVHFDPRRRYVVCATALIGGTETLVGVGAIELAATARPHILVCDEEHADEVAPLLTRALLDSAGLTRRSHAA